MAPCRGLKDDNMLMNLLKLNVTYVYKHFLIEWTEEKEVSVRGRERIQVVYISAYSVTN